MVGKAFCRLQGKEMRKGKGAGALRALPERYNPNPAVQYVCVISDPLYVAPLLSFIADLVLIRDLACFAFVSF